MKAWIFLCLAWIPLLAEKQLDEILEYAYHRLPNCGVLRASSEELYVELDEEYVKELITFIRGEGFDEPSAPSARAQISVMDKVEAPAIDFSAIEEEGEMVYFTAKKCEVVENEKAQELCLVGVEAPELQRIRSKYGLPSFEDEFYIKIGVRSQDLAWLSY